MKLKPCKYKEFTIGSVKVLVYADMQGIGLVNMTDKNTGEQCTITRDVNEHTETKEFDEVDEKVLVITKSIRSSVDITLEKPSQK